MCCLWCGFWFLFYIDLFFRTLTQKFFVSHGIHGIHGNAVASPAFTIFIFRHEDKSTKKSPTNSTNIH